MTEVAVSGTIAIPEATGAQEVTSFADCDVAIADLVEHAQDWFSVPANEVKAILERFNDQVRAESRGWVAAACAAKRIAADGPAAAEEWASVAVTARYANLLTSSLTDIAGEQRPAFPGRPRQVTGGRLAVPVFPINTIDKVTFSGISAAVWLRRGTTTATAVEHQAAAWFGGGTAGVSLVLGGGNQASIPIVDALEQLVVARHPVVLKMNPVNDYLGPIFERLTAELIQRGVLRIVYGGAEVGSYLVGHDGIDDVHVTGSDKTYESIVFGPGPQGARRKADQDPIVTKPVTGELGNVSPVIVVPGPWSAKDLSFQAQNIASMLTQNAGFNCVALRALIISASWDQGDALLTEISTVLREADDRYPYYPGARQRFDRFLAAHPDAEKFGDDSDEGVPFTMIRGLRPGAENEIAFSTEAFNGVFAEVAIDAAGTVDYIRRAVDFANDGLWGTLGCSIIVSPKSLETAEVQRAVEQAIADLRYGTIVVNHWSGIGFGMGSTPWGAYPGHTSSDVQSGLGFVHNSLMIAAADIEKTVIRGPFRTPVKPNWFVTNSTAHKSGERFARMMTKPSWTKLPGVIAASVRG
jgi:Aldehyde dehydrogenase family